MSVRLRADGDLPALVADLRWVHERDGYPVRWKDDPATATWSAAAGREPERLSCGGASLLFVAPA